MKLNERASDLKSERIILVTENLDVIKRGTIMELLPGYGHREVANTFQAPLKTEAKTIESVTCVTLKDLPVRSGITLRELKMIHKHSIKLCPPDNHAQSRDCLVGEIEFFPVEFQDMTIKYSCISYAGDEAILEVKLEG